MKRFAHSVEGQPEEMWEPLPHHLAAVGRRAADFASWFGASRITLAMGLLHDIGKVALPYQVYIRRPSNKGSAKGPDHSTAGAKEAVALYGRQVGRMMAFGIAGHHAGLMDGAGHEGGNLLQRLAKEVEDYEGWRDHISDLPTVEELRSDFPVPHPNIIEPGFSLAFLTRMLFSCLVDADFLETEAFYAQSRGEDRPPRGGVVEPGHVRRVSDFVERHRRADTPVNILRSKILDHANAKAALPPGLFTLTVPTGGGKTLTSLSFAMRHAAAHGLRRIIYVLPFTAIIEQTAKIFREDVGLGDAVLEHHSSFEWDKRAPGSEDDADGEGPAGLAKLRRDAENWNAPIVVTTAVQFFESLFASRTSRARKLHNLAKSVIILDEAQAIPVHLLRPCMAAIDELARNYGASIILCTATQPALRAQDDALPKKGKSAIQGLTIPDDRELAPDPKGLYDKLKRVNVEWRREPVGDEEIAVRFAEQSQMLCIVNSRAHARSLFEAIREQDGAIHLTTLMCARHRRVVLARARDDLQAGRPVRLVATSLIEAGVDISFPEVWRAAAGLASIAQSAGRANRSGELGPLGKVFGRAVVFEPALVEGRKSVPDMIRPFYQAAKNVLRANSGDLLALDAVREYYSWLYWQLHSQNDDAFDAATMDGHRFEIIRAIRDTAHRLEFPFARIARAFRMIDEAMDPVIVLWGENKEDRREIETLIRDMEDRPFLPAGAQRKLQQYVVPVPARAREKLLAARAAQAIRPDDYGDRFVVLRNQSLYDPALGLHFADPTWRSSEDSFF